MMQYNIGYHLICLVVLNPDEPPQLPEENLSATKNQRLAIPCHAADPYVNALDGTQSADIVKAKLHALPRPSEPHRLSTAPAIQILVLRKPYNIIQ
jgi:hypothetical protein